MIASSVFLSIAAAAFIFLTVLRFRGLKEVHYPFSLSALALASLLFVLFDDVSWILPAQSIDSVLLTVMALWWFCLAFVANATLKHFFFKSTLASGEGSDVPLVLQHLIGIMIYLIALMVVLQYIFGQSITALATASGAIALILGYSSRTVLEELFSGLALYANEPFEKNHLIQLNNEWFYVVDINWRTTTFLDMDQNTVVIPNTTVASSAIRNLDRPSPMTRRTLFFEVEYNIPPKVVVAEAEAAMKECPHVAEHPWNFVSFFSFEETGMKYKLHFHVTHYDDWYVASDELVSALWYRFSRMGIRFAHQRYLNYKTEEDEKKGLRNSAYDDANYKKLVERFCHIPIFDGMTDLDMDELVKTAPVHILGPPEHLTYAGSVHSSMFLIVSGEVNLFEVDAMGHETQMGSIAEAEYVGLMALLTGAPQRVTARAAKESVVCEVTSDALHALFERKPEVMQKIAERIAKWQVEEEEALSAIARTRAQENAAIKKRMKSLSNLITEFFVVSSEETDSKV